MTAFPRGAEVSRLFSSSYSKLTSGTRPRGERKAEGVPAQTPAEWGGQGGGDGSPSPRSSVCNSAGSSWAVVPSSFLSRSHNHGSRVSTCNVCASMSVFSPAMVSFLRTAPHFPNLYILAPSRACHTDTLDKYSLNERITDTFLRNK